MKIIVFSLCGEFILHSTFLRDCFFSHCVEAIAVLLLCVCGDCLFCFFPECTWKLTSQCFSHNVCGDDCCFFLCEECLIDRVWRLFFSVEFVFSVFTWRLSFSCFIARSHRCVSLLCPEYMRRKRQRSSRDSSILVALCPIFLGALLNPVSVDTTSHL